MTIGEKPLFPHNIPSLHCPMKTIAFLLLSGAGIAFLFNALVNLEELGIGVWHPWVWVEAGLGIPGLAGGRPSPYLSR
jgi:hypothetical protein